MNVREALARLGIEALEEQGDEIVARCPGHVTVTGKADHDPSWSINSETGVHYCFSCHFKGNLYTLAVEMVGPEEAKSYLRGGSAVLAPVRKGYRVSRNMALPTLPKPRRPLSESELALYSDAPQWALDARRVDRGALDFFGVKWDRDEEAWVLPYRQPGTRDLIGYQIKYERIRRMINVPIGVDKASTFFGITEAEGADEVVVVESPLDAVLLHTLGYPAVAICGSRLSEAQAGLLLGFRMVVLALDDDDAGRRETDRIARAGLGFYFRLAKYQGRGKDVGEMGVADIESALRAKGNR